MNNLTTEECQDLVAWAVMHKLISYRLVTDEERRFIIMKTGMRKKPIPCRSLNEPHAPSASVSPPVTPSERPLEHVK